MFKVAIATSGLDKPEFEYTVSIVEMLIRMMMEPIFPGVPQGLKYLTPETSCVLSANRERHAESFLETDCTHLAYIDADMGFESDVMHILARRKLPYVACNYPMKKKEQNEFTALQLDRKCRVWTGPESTGVEEVDFTGFGFALIERKVIEAVPRPRFLIGYNMATDHYTTEDAPFCHKVREAGFPVCLDHDATKRVWHMGKKAYRWDEVPKPKELENGE